MATEVLAGWCCGQGTPTPCLLPTTPELGLVTPGPPRAQGYIATSPVEVRCGHSGGLLRQAPNPGPHLGNAGKGRVFSVFLVVLETERNVPSEAWLVALPRGPERAALPAVLGGLPPQVQVGSVAGQTATLRALLGRRVGVGLG